MTTKTLLGGAALAGLLLMPLGAAAAEMPNGDAPQLGAPITFIDETGALCYVFEPKIQDATADERPDPRLQVICGATADTLII
ncbi:MAG: hypothetical protein MJE12_30165 [Alphaproteobacteria bacterium]|nr:hypothetical protein [Alphaproteobacteria bacterium]